MLYRGLKGLCRLRLSWLAVLSLWGAFLAFSLLACSDDDSSIEFLFDREASDISVLRSCATDGDTSACYRIRLRYPIETNHFKRIYMWVDTTVVNDSSKAVSSDQRSKATATYDYPKGTKALYDTIDVTEYAEKYIGTYDSLQVAFYCEYDDGGDPGAVQRVFLHFGDDMPPSRASIYDSVWTNGAMIEWYRPTDQTDFYKPTELSGPIVGYNIVLYSPDKDEDLRNITVRLYSPDGQDMTGGALYKRHSRIRANNDSVWVDGVGHGDNVKNYLRFVVLDGKGFNFDVDSLNRFRVVFEGLRARSKYNIGLSSWDSSGNSSGNEGVATVESYQLFMTTDSIAPLMPTKLYVLEDTLFPGMARLDSNNRLRIFWSRSLDPTNAKHGIIVDTVLWVPDTCGPVICFETVETYVVDRYDVNKKAWVTYDDVGGSDRYSTLYSLSGDTMKVSTYGSFVTDTIRWVSPGDTLILRIRSVDNSGYYSAALIDTIVVSPGILASQVTCPDKFLPVSVSKDTVFCMERFEHQNDSGKFVNNVLYSEALATCEAISASGFKVSLCNERDWERVCLSGGTLSYGVLQEEDIDATEYLFSYCNVATNDSLSANDVSLRNPRCVNPMGIRDFPGQLQEWVRGRSEDSAAVVKGGSYKVFNGLDRESIAYCTNRSFPYFTRLEYVKDSVFLYREGAKVDTVYAADTTRTLYKLLRTKDFKDSLQFFKVQDSTGNVIGEDYALYSEYKNGGDKWLESIGNGLKYVPDRMQVVFLTGRTTAYRGASAYYKSPVIGFRCCAYPE